MARIEQGLADLALIYQQDRQGRMPHGERIRVVLERGLWALPQIARIRLTAAEKQTILARFPVDNIAVRWQRGRVSVAARYHHADLPLQLARLRESVPCGGGGAYRRTDIRTDVPADTVIACSLDRTCSPVNSQGLLTPVPDYDGIGGAIRAVRDIHGNVPVMWYLHGLWKPIPEFEPVGDWSDVQRRDQRPAPMFEE